jgi:hypothetical protein
MFVGGTCRKNEKYFLTHEEGVIAILNFSINLTVCRATSQKI